MSEPTSSEVPFVSVIVPARDASNTLPECLLALRAQSYPRDAYEVIVVDDGSADETARVAEQFWAQVVSIPPSGPGAARNRGVEAARGGLVLFTDADCAPGPQWIRELVIAVAPEDVVAAKGTYRSEQKSWTAQFVQAEYESRYRLVRERRTIDFIDTYSVAFDRKAFEAAGGFDESFTCPCVEDQEFGFRLAQSGARMVFAPRAVVAHYHAETPRAYTRKKFKIAYWKMKVLARYPGKAISDSHTPWQLKAEIVSVGALAALCASAAVGWSSAWFPLAPLALFLGVIAPFVVALLPKNRGLAWRAPFFLALRATALGTGMMAGILGRPWREREAELRTVDSQRVDRVTEPENPTNETAEAVERTAAG